MEGGAERFSFEYHMNGLTAGTLSIETQSGFTGIWTEVWSFTWRRMYSKTDSFYAECINFGESTSGIRVKYVTAVLQNIGFY